MYSQMFHINSDGSSKSVADVIQNTENMWPVLKA